MQSQPQTQGDTNNNNNNNGTDLFEELLETHGPKPLQRGQTVEGEIIKLEDNLAIVDVGAKRDAIVPPEEMDEVTESFLESLDEGDNVYVYVIRTPIGDEELLVSLEKGLREQDWERAVEYLENQEALGLKVTGKNKGGLLVEFGRLQGFVPTSHVPRLQRLRNQGALAGQKSELIGEELLLKVIEVDRQRRRLILSAKKAQKEVREKRLLELKQQEGETIIGQITNLVSFGAFVDLGGLEGLVHISEIAWQQVDDPADWLTPGEEIEVAILSVDVEKERVSLSRKALLPNPWDTFAETHRDGELIEGVVTNVVDFGAFVLVSEGIEGLLHVSEMRGTQDFAPQDVLYPDDNILVRILQIDPDRERLSLSQRRVRQQEEIDWIRQRQQETESEPELETEPDLELETEPDLELETEPDLELETEPDLELETEPDLELETEPDLELETEPDLELETEPDLELETEPDLKLETEPDLELETEPEPEPDLEPDQEGGNDK